MSEDTPAPAAQIKHEMRTKTIPENGTYRIDRVEDGRLIISLNGVDYDADPSGVSTVVEAGNYVRVEFDGKIAKIVERI